MIRCPISDLRFSIGGSARSQIANRRLKISMLFALCFLLAASVLYAGENDEEKDRIIDLPTVKIEILDTTQISIPKEKFRSFTKPDSSIYAPLSPKERPWYLPPTLSLEKLREAPVEAEKDFLFSLSAHSGVPTVLAYRIFLVRGFGRSEALLDMGRLTLMDERTPGLVSGTSKGLGKFTIDKLRGTLAHQREDFSLKADVHYNAKELGYLDESGKAVEPNDRTLAGLSIDWRQKLPGGARPSLNIAFSNLRMEGPFSTGHENGSDLKTDFGIGFLWPRANPLDAGLGVEYFAGESDIEEFKEAIVRLYLRDNYIKIWSFALGVGMELMLDARKDSAEDEDWGLRVYPNPELLLTSQIGVRTVLQFAIDRRVLRQQLRSLYLDRDYVRFKPDVNPERTWNLDASLEYRLTRRFATSVEAFGKEIRDLTVFEKTGGGTLSWEPNSWDSMRIFGFSIGCELSLLGDKLKQSFEYTHESHEREIPYRPKDRGTLTIMYLAPFGLEPSLSAEFYGTRYLGEARRPENQDPVSSIQYRESLSSYFLWKPRISKAFGKYASVFLAAEFYVGQDEYQIWEGYELPTQIVDFGLTLKF